MTFVLFHGSFGYNDGNWFPYIKSNLEKLNQKVYTPQFPIDDWEDITNNGMHVFPKNQKLTNWFKTFEENYVNFKDDKLCFIGHSVGCLFILHILQKYNIQLDSAMFISPFLTKLGTDWQIDHVNNSFYKDTFDFDTLKKHLNISYSIYSDNDPYADFMSSERFTDKLSCSKIIIKEGQHLNSEAQILKLPILFDLCTSRLPLESYKDILLK